MGLGVGVLAKMSVMQCRIYEEEIFAFGLWNKR